MKVDMSPEAITKRLKITNELWIRMVRLMDVEGTDAETAKRIVNERYERGELDIVENRSK
jgi:hypothetical protein